MLSLNVSQTQTVMWIRSATKVPVGLHVAKFLVVRMQSVGHNFTRVFANVSVDLKEIQLLHVQKVCVPRYLFVPIYCFRCIFNMHDLLTDEIILPPIDFGCISNNDCPDYTACENRKCINPCAADDVCAPNAICTVSRHKALCACPDGYIGTPEISCSLRKLTSSLIGLSYFEIVILKVLASITS